MQAFAWDSQTPPWLIVWFRQLLHSVSCSGVGFPTLQISQAENMHWIIASQSCPAVLVPSRRHCCTQALSWQVWNTQVNISPHFFVP